MNKLCDYGCGKEAKFYFKIVKKWCCCKHQNSCTNMRENIGYPKGRKNIKLSKIMKEKIPWNLGIKGYHIHSEEWKENLRNEMKEFRSSKMNTKDHIEKIRKRMLNGGAAKACSGNKSPSKPQVELYNLVKSLIYTAVINYPIIELNCVLDIAIPNYKIVIEFDGSYWHQDKEKDLKRQIEVEKLGWKFIRYNDIIPKKEDLIEDLKNLEVKL